MHRGLEIDIHLRPGLSNDAFVAEALGNLAASRLAAARGERLAWQVLQVDGSKGHHFRLVIAHPDRVLDVGIGHALRAILDALSAESVEELTTAFRAAQKAGLRPVPLRHVRLEVDYWRDDFWNWFG